MLEGCASLEKPTTLKGVDEKSEPLQLQIGRRAGIRDSMSDGGWNTIESEPAVFHQLIRDFGCTGVQV